MVLEEYLRTGQPKKALQQKYGIKGHSRLCAWLRQYQYTDIHVKGGTLPSVTLPSLAAKEPITDSPVPGKAPFASDQARIKELERQLEDAQLRAEAYSRMITLAEQAFNIPIRKKSGTR